MLVRIILVVSNRNPIQGDITKRQLKKTYVTGMSRTGFRYGLIQGLSWCHQDSSSLSLSTNVFAGGAILRQGLFEDGH